MRAFAVVYGLAIAVVGSALAILAPTKLVLLFMIVPLQTVYILTVHTEDPDAMLSPARVGLSGLITGAGGALLVLGVMAALFDAMSASISDLGKITGWVVGYVGPWFFFGMFVAQVLAFMQLGRHRTGRQAAIRQLSTLSAMAIGAMLFAGLLFPVVSARPFALSGWGTFVGLILGGAVLVTTLGPWLAVPFMGRNTVCEEAGLQD